MTHGEKWASLDYVLSRSFDGLARLRGEHMKSQWAFVGICGLLVLASLGLDTSPAQAQALAPSAQRKAEVEAKKAFVSANYQTAKELYSELYSQTSDPVYLRNLGRCFEELGEPGPALSNFRLYLLKTGKALSAREHEEIEGRIAAMQKLQGAQQNEEKRRNDEEAAVKLRTRETADAAAAAELQRRQAEEALAAAETQRRQAEAAARIAQSAGPGALGQDGIGSSTQTSESSLHASPTHPPATSTLRSVGTGLLIASAVTMVVGGALMYSAWSTYRSNNDGKCGDSTTCAAARDSINTKNLWSKVSLGVGAGAAAMGGTLILLAPSPSSPKGASASMTWTF